MAPIALFVKLGWGIGHALLLSQVLVAVVALPVAGVFGQMQGQGAVRAEKPEEPVRQPPGAFARRRLEPRDGRGRKCQLRLLAQADAILRRAAAFAKPGHVGIGRLDHPERLEDVEGLGVFGQLREMRQTIRPSPFAGRHRAISPLWWVVRTVSVKLFIETYFSKNF